MLRTTAAQTLFVKDPLHTEGDMCRCTSPVYSLVSQLWYGPHVLQLHVASDINRYCEVREVGHVGCYHTGPQQHVWFVQFQIYLQKEIILSQRHDIFVTVYAIN